MLRFADIRALTGIPPGSLRHILADLGRPEVGRWRWFGPRDALAAATIAALARQGMTAAGAKRLVREHVWPDLEPVDRNFADLVRSCDGIRLVTTRGQVNVGALARDLAARA